jgi:site-specific DNA recombinase
MPRLSNSLLIWAFEEIAKGMINTEQVYKLIVEKGFSHSKARFWTAIRNLLYCGKIYILKYKDEAGYFVKGQHEALNSEGLFYLVQDILDGRGRTYRLKVVSNDCLPLRGFLICPECGKLATGSASKGTYKYYPYYHCSNGCKFRVRAEIPNEQLLRELQKYSPRPEMAEVYKAVLTKTWNEQSGEEKSNRTHLAKKVKELESKISYIRELLSTQKLDPEDFKEMKMDYMEQIEKIEVQLSHSNSPKASITDLLKTGISKLLTMTNAYENADSDKRREIIDSIFPDKIRFENGAVRINRVNEVVNFIYLITNDLGGNKKRQNGDKTVLSREVGVAGFEPTTSCSQSRRDTGLRYTPNLISKSGYE